MPYPAPTNYSLGMAQMPTVGADQFGNELPSMANHQSHQSMSARTSRSNSLIRPGSGMDENRRSMSGMDFASSRVNFNDFRPNGVPNGYGTQQDQNGSGANNHYNYDQAAANSAMAQNGLPIKSEGADTASYGDSNLSNVDGISNGQDNSLWRNGTFNGDSNFMNNSTAGPPYQPKAGGVLTVPTI